MRRFTQRQIDNGFRQLGIASEDKRRELSQLADLSKLSDLADLGRDLEARRSAGGVERDHAELERDS